MLIFFTLWLYVVHVYIPLTSVSEYNRYLSFLAFSLSSPASSLIPILTFREHMYGLIRIRSLFSPAPTYSANKKTSATILICSRMHSAHAIVHLVVPRFSAFHPDDNSRVDDDDKLQPGALMHRKCPSAGKSPDAENSRTLRSAFSSLVDLRCCSDWHPLPVLRLKYLRIVHVISRSERSTKALEAETEKA